MARGFLLQGAAVIRKIQLSAAARQQLQNLVINVDTSQVQQALSNLGTQIQNVFKPIQRAGQTAAGFNKFANALNGVSTAANKAAASTKKLDSLFIQVIRKASAFRISTIFINSVFNALNEATRFTIAFDDSLRDINKILRLSDKELNNLGDSLITIAARFNQSSEEVAKAAKAAAQAGFFGVNASDAEKVATTLSITAKAALLAQTTTLGFEESLQGLLSISRQTNSSLEDATILLTKFSAIEDASAIDAKELTEVFKRAGTSLSQAFGPNLNNAIGGVAALLERTRQSAPVIGTFFKTLIARLSGTNQEVINAFNELGISITDKLTGSLKEPFELLTELQDKLVGLSGADAGRIIGRIGGVRQAELFKALLEVLPKRAGGASRQTELSAAAAKGFSLQVEKARQDSEKLAAKINEMQQGFYKFVNSLKEKLLPVFDTVISSVNWILNALNNPLSGTSWVSQLLKVGSVLAAGGLFNQLFGGVINKKFGFDPQAASKGRTVTTTWRTSSGALATRKRVVNGPNKLNAAFNKATQVLKPFSIKALGASLALGLLGDMLTKLGNEGTESEKKWLVAMGKMTETFGTMLAFGPKFAFFATALNVVTSAATTVVRAFGALNNSIDGTIAYLEGELEDNTTNFIRDIFSFIPGVGRDKKTSRENLEELKIRKREMKFDKGINSENMAEADQLLNAFAGSVKEFSNTFAEDLAKVRDSVDGFTLEDVSKKMRKSVQEYIGSLTDGMAPQISALLTNGRALSRLGPELQALFEANSKLKGATKTGVQNKLADIVADVALQYAKLESFKRVSAVTSPISDEDLDKEEELSSSRSEVAVASLEALMAEQRLFSLRSNTSGLKDAIALEEEITKIRESEFEKQLAAVKKQQFEIAKAARDSAARLVFGIQGQLKTLIDSGVGEDNQVIQNLSKQLIDAGDAARIAEENFKNFASSKSNIEELSAIEREYTEFRLSAIVKQFDATRSLIEEENRLVKSRIDESVAIANALTDQENARKGLARILGGKGPTFDIDSAREELEFNKRSNEIKLAGIDQEIAAIENLRKVAIEARQAELISILKILEASPDKDTDIGKAQIANVKKELEKTLTAELKISEEMKKLMVERTVLIAKAKTEELNALAKIFDLEEKIKNERIDGATKLLDLSRSLKDGVRSLFEAQKSLTDSIRQKLDEAANEVKSKRGALSSAFDELANARKSLFNAIKGGQDTFAQFNLEIAKASVAARKVMGEFFGLRQEADALAAAYQDTIDAAQAAGASEEKLAELRYESAQEQLSLFQNLLDEQRSKADRFFTSSGEDRQNFVQGLAAIQQIASQFSGNIENFRNLDTNELNNLGRSLLSLPQSLRENISNALDQLPNGVGIAGLTQDNIKEILQGATLGESESVGIERLSDTMQTVADLTRNVAELNKSQLISQQKSLIDLKANVANAKEQVLIAKNALYQAQIDAINTQKAIREVVSTVDSQIGEYRQEFKQKVDFIVSSVTDPMERQAKLTEVMVQAQQTISSILSKTAGFVGQVGPDFRVNESFMKLPSAITSPNSPGREIINTIGVAIGEANAQLVESIEGLKTTISSNWADNMALNTEALQRLASEVAAAAVERLEEIKAEIKIDNTQKINITGATEVVQQIMSALEVRGFVTEEQLEDIRKTISKIVEDQIRAGSSRPGALFR